MPKEKQTINQATTEIGALTNLLSTGYDNEVSSSDTHSIDDYLKMSQNDGDIAAIKNLITLPIINAFASAETRIDPDEDGDQGETEFIRKNLLTPRQKGGMSTPLKDVVRDMTRAIFEGYRAYELVFELVDGYYHIRKIAPRDNRTTEPISDERGGFDGLRQKCTVNGKYIDVIIPKEKSVLFTHNKQRNWLKGESILRAAYYHYDKKHRLYYLAHKAVEFGIIPPIIIKWKEQVSTSKQQESRRAISKLGFKPVISVPSIAELDKLDVRTAIDQVNQLIEHHSIQIHKSVMTQFIALGKGENTGAYALSKNESDIFLDFINSYVQDIADIINNFIIPKLIDINFANGYYPRIQPGKTNKDSELILRDVYNAIIKQPTTLPNEFILRSVQKLADEINVEFDVEEEIKKAQENEIKMANDKTQLQKELNIDENKEAQAELMNELKKKDVFAESEFKPWRKLTKAESKVDFDGLSRKTSAIIDFVANNVREVFDKQKKALTKDIQAIIKSKDIKAVETLSMKYVNEYKDIIDASTRQMYEYAKVKASKEIKQRVPDTTNPIKQLFNQKALVIAEQHRKAVENLVKHRLLEYLSTEAVKAEDDRQVEFDILNGIVNFEEKKINLTSDILVAWAINIARNEVFETYKDQISRYQYSAIMDMRTCDYCRSLDGKIVDKNDPAFLNYSPPAHYQCFDDKTEVLTNNGFVLFSELNGDEKILSVDLKDGHSEFVGIKNIIQQKTDTMVSYSNNQFDLMNTTDHNQVVKFRIKQKGRKDAGYYKIVPENKLPNHDFNFLATIPNYIGNKQKYIKIGKNKFNTENFVEFMGYYLSEGSISKPKNGKWQIKITQEKHYCKMIECTKKLFHKIWAGEKAFYIPLEDKKLIEWFKQFGYSYNKFIPQEIKNLDKEYLDIFLTAYNLGDGSIIKGKFWKNSQFNDMRIYYTSSKRMADDIGELILKIGKRPSFTKPVTPLIKQIFKNGEYFIKHPCWTVCELNHTEPGRDRLKRKVVKYNGYAWDVELEKYHTLFVRRNGKVILSGNCRCIWVAILNDEMDKPEITGIGDVATKFMDQPIKK